MWWMGKKQTLCGILSEAMLAIITSYSMFSTGTTCGLLSDGLVVKHTTAINRGAELDLWQQTSVIIFFLFWYLCNFYKTHIP